MADAALSQVVVLLSAVLAAIGAYGLAGSKNLVRQLISAEVIFNAILLLIIVVLSGSSLAANILGIMLVIVVSGEIIVVVALVAALYRRLGTLETMPLEEEGV
ncbi:NADH-quinone oxidoreductase subunit NuoK [Aeropyrum camini]|uniref:NuoK-like protein n=1 Tax=Aeropyrum camini SY1 = JCM 12091 TaxID=1198449 RepID=U3TE94_9CREN|nr:NADH-quinone oxidoreductase subunit K [Aeropyrum camini]BAN90360.1 NuoK-like protein [Aeropyrum camini SY1 = JCM 12091]